MTKPTRKQVILIIVAVLILAALLYGFLPGAVSVQTDLVKSASMQVIVEEEGETYVEQHYLISSPVAAYIRRIGLDPGDEIEAGDALIELEPPRSAILDPRSREEAKARVEAAEASLDQAEALAVQAVNERDRLERLYDSQSATRQELDRARTEAAGALSSRNAARAELAAARAVFTNENITDYSVGQVLRAPAAGRVLTIHGKSERHVNAGDPLLEIGDTEHLEVHIEVLSQDAVRITPGMRVLLDQWGGEEPLEARVNRVEQQGRVVVSALGVEERRVQVIADLISPPEERRGLGSGYRVLARFILWEEDQVLQVPASALFRVEEGRAVFVVEDGRATRKGVTIGYQSGLSAQVLEGLREGDIVITHPGDAIEDGVKVSVKQGM